MTQLKWEQGPTANETLQGEGFYISYNPNPSAAPGMEIWSMFGDNTKEETALCFNDKGRDKFLVLNGDFRNQYAELVPQGLQACIDLYFANPERHSEWSSNYEQAPANR